MTPTRPIVFVVSTGRTATTFLARFAADLGAEGRHEAGPWWLRHLSNAYASGHVDHDRAVRLLRSRRAGIGTERPYLEASCLLYGLVAPLLDAFPTAQVVQVVRDPRTYVASARSWGAYRLGGRPLNIVPFRRLAPPQFRPWDPVARLRWVADDQFARLCWAWAAMNEAMRTQGADRERFRTVRFEDLTEPGDPAGELRRLADDLGLGTGTSARAEPEAAAVNASGHDATAGWPSWTASQRRLLIERTAAEAAHHGYPLDPPVPAP